MDEYVALGGFWDAKGAFVAPCDGAQDLCHFAIVQSRFSSCERFRFVHVDKLSLFAYIIA